jgi:hypothetical protein
LFQKQHPAELAGLRVLSLILLQGGFRTERERLCCKKHSKTDLLSPTIFEEPFSLALEEVMRDLADLMQRLMELQSGGRHRSPELLAEDERLMDGLQKRNLAEKSALTTRVGQATSGHTQFEV